MHKSKKGNYHLNKQRYVFGVCYSRKIDNLRHTDTFLTNDGPQVSSKFSKVVCPYGQENYVMTTAYHIHAHVQAGRFNKTVRQATLIRGRTPLWEYGKYATYLYIAQVYRSTGSTRINLVLLRQQLSSDMMDDPSSILINISMPWNTLLSKTAFYEARQALHVARIKDGRHSRAIWNVVRLVGLRNTKALVRSSCIIDHPAKQLMRAPSFTNEPCSKILLRTFGLDKIRCNTSDIVIIDKSGINNTFLTDWGTFAPCEPEWRTSLNWWPR